MVQNQAEISSVAIASKQGAVGLGEGFVVVVVGRVVVMLSTGVVVLVSSALQLSPLQHHMVMFMCTSVMLRYPS